MGKMARPSGVLIDGFVAVICVDETKIQRVVWRGMCRLLGGHPPYNGVLAKGSQPECGIRIKEDLLIIWAIGDVDIFAGIKVLPGIN